MEDTITHTPRRAGDLLECRSAAVPQCRSAAVPQCRSAAVPQVPKLIVPCNQHDCQMPEKM